MESREGAIFIAESKIEMLQKQLAEAKQQQKILEEQNQHLIDVIHLKNLKIDELKSE